MAAQPPHKTLLASPYSKKNPFPLHYRRLKTTRRRYGGGCRRFDDSASFLFYTTEFGERCISYQLSVF
jgi:hypothetical protein